MSHAQIGFLGLVCHGRIIILFLAPKYIKQLSITQCVNGQNTHQLPCKDLSYDPAMLIEMTNVL